MANQFQNDDFIQTAIKARNKNKINDGFPSFEEFRESIGGGAPKSEAATEGNDTVGNGFLGHFIDSAQAGAASSVAGLATFGQEFLPVGKDLLGEIAKEANDFAARNTAPPETLTGANWVANAVGNAVGSGLPSLLGGAVLLGAASAAGISIPAAITIGVYKARHIPVIGKMLRMSRKMWSSPFGKLAIAETAGSGVEGVTEAGNLITEMRKEGYSDEDIRNAALESAKLNTSWLLVANAIGGALTAKYGKEAVKGGLRQLAKNAGKGALLEGASEGVQEFGQSLIGNEAKGEEYDYGQAGEAAAQAFVGSGILGGIGGAAAPYFNNEPQKKVKKSVTKKAVEPTADNNVPPPPEGPNSVVADKLDVNQARTVLDGYRDSLGAGEEYNDISDFMLHGSDEDIVNAAKKIIEQQTKNAQTRDALDVEEANGGKEEPPVEVKPVEAVEPEKPTKAKTPKKPKQPKVPETPKAPEVPKTPVEKPVETTTPAEDTTPKGVEETPTSDGFKDNVGDFVKNQKLSGEGNIVYNNPKTKAGGSIAHQEDGTFKATWSKDGNTKMGKFNTLEEAENFLVNGGKKKAEPVEAPAVVEEPVEKTEKSVVKEVTKEPVERDEFGYRETLGDYKATSRDAFKGKYRGYTHNEKKYERKTIHKNDDDTYMVESSTYDDDANDIITYDTFLSLEDAENFIATGKKGKKHKLKTFQAVVIDSDGKMEIMTRAYKTKEHFKSDLKGNGYKVRYISTPENFEADGEKWHRKNEFNKAVQKNIRKYEKERKAKEVAQESTPETTKVETTPVEEVENIEPSAPNSWDSHISNIEGDYGDELSNILSSANEAETKASKRTKKKSKEDKELEVAVRQQEVTEELEAPTTVEEYLKQLKGQTKGSAVAYFKDKPDRVEFVEKIANGSKFELYQAVQGSKTKYYYQTSEMKDAEEIPKAEAEAIRVISLTEDYKPLPKKLTQAEIKAQEESKYIKEIPEDAADDFLDEIGMEDKALADAFYEVLFMDDPSSNDGKTVEETIREAAFFDLSYRNQDNVVYDNLIRALAKKGTYIKAGKREYSIDYYAEAYFEALIKKHQNIVKDKSRDTETDLDLQQSIQEQLDVLGKYVDTKEAQKVLDYINANNPSVDFDSLTTTDIKEYIKEYKEQQNKPDTADILKALDNDPEAVAAFNAANEQLNNRKFQLKDEDKLDDFQPDLLGQLIHFGKRAIELTKDRFVMKWETFITVMSQKFQANLDAASKLFASVWEFLQKLPENVAFNVKHAIDSLALAGRYKGNNEVRKNIKNSKLPLKDYIDAAYAAIKRYPRQNKNVVVESEQRGNEGGNNDVNVRMDRPDEGSGNSGRSSQSMEIPSGTSDTGTPSQSERETLQGTSGQRVLGTGGQNVSGTGTDSGRTQGNQQGSSENAGNPNGSTGNLNGRGSSSGSPQGNSVSGNVGQSEQIATLAQGGRPNENSGRLLDDRQRGLTAQQEINNQKSVNVQAGDLANIAETLPVLYEGQHSDIRNAEKRLYVDNGKGMLIADGTGCGKTLVGLGLIKRANWQGKKNILVVVPTSDIAKAWHNDGKLLGYTDEDYADITTSGIVKDKINVITYASLYQNKDLLENKWDLILCDESHHLAAGENSTEENPAEAVSALRAITGHREGFNGWFKLRHQEELEQLKALQREAKPILTQMAAIDTAINLGVNRAQEVELRKAKLEFKKQLDPLLNKTKDLKQKLDAQRVKDKPTWNQYVESVKDTRVLMLSATPFAYAQNVYLAEGYLFNYRDFGGNFRAMMTSRFGYVITPSGKLKDPIKAGKSLNNNINEWAFHNALIASGSMSKRSLEIDQDYNRQFVKVKAGIGTEIDRAMDVLERGYSTSGLFEAITKMFPYHQKRRICEAIKASEVIPMIKDYLKQGKQVVLFHDTKINEPIKNPFNLSDEDLKELSDAARNDYYKFKREHPEFLDLQLENLKPPIETIKEAFGKDLMTINGATSKQDKRDAAGVFQGKKPFDKSKDDSTQGKLIMLTVDAGKEGISLHDTSEGGKVPRVLINLGMPTKPTDVIQLEGRIYRYGQTSNAQFRYLTTGTKMENQAFMNRISTRSKTAENFALGEDARKLDLRLMLGYLKAESGSTNFNALDDVDNSGGKVEDHKNAEELNNEFNRLFGSLDGDFRVQAREVFDRELAVEQEVKNTALRTPENEAAFVQTLKDNFFTDKVEKLVEGVWKATLANGDSVIFDLSKSSMELVKRASAQQQQAARKAHDIKSANMTISGLFEQTFTKGVKLNIIRLTEAAKKNTLDHETFHFILNVLFTKAERDYVLKYFEHKLKKSIGEKAFNALTPEERLLRAEEMACDDYADTVGLDRTKWTMNNAIKKVMLKINKFLAKVFNSWGEDSLTGMYLKAMEGEVFQRTPQEQAQLEADLKAPEPLRTEIQPDGIMKFSAEPTDVVENKMARDLIAGTLAEANALADANGVEQGLLEIKAKEKTPLQKMGIAPLLEIIKSPSRMAEKYPVFKSFYRIFLKAQEVQEKLREQWNKRFNNALGLLKDEKQLNEYLDIMVAGEYEAKVYEVDELKEMGYSEKAIFAYRRTRKLIDDIWKAVNDAHRGLKEYTKVVNHKELKALKEDQFIENLMVQEAHSDKVVPAKDVKPILGMTYKVTYSKPKVFKSKKQLTKEQLHELEVSPYAKVSQVKEVYDEAAGVKYYEATVEQTPAPIGKITGYLPHIFEQWMVYVNTEDGTKPIASAKTLKEAVAEGTKILDANPKLAITVQPKMFKPEDFLGGEGTHGKSLGLTMSDEEYARLQRGLVENSKMTLSEAREALKNVAHRTSRNRFFGNIRHRKGRAGYNQDVIESLNRYMTMASRYCALQPAKSEAIPLYERTFKTAWDKDVPRDMPMARIIKDYIYYNNGTPNDWETRFNEWLNRWSWWRDNVSANYGDRSALVAIGKINSLVSVAKLGFFNVSSAFVNLSQLKSTYALVGESGIAEGIKAMKRMNRLDKRVIEDTGVRYNIGLDTVSGFTKRRVAPNAGKAATAVARLRNAYNTFADKSMVLFKTSEAYIRKLTVLSAYYKAIDDGMTHKEAIEFAKDVNRKANFDYGAADAPAIFRKAAGTPLDLALLFKKYPIKELEMISTMLPVIGSGTKAQKARYWGMYFLLAGLFGFPAGDWIDELMESILGYKPSTLGKAWMFKTFGDNKATRMMIYGAGAGIGVDISKRVGMADMIPSEGNMLAYLTGAAGSTVWQMANAIASGDATKVVKAYSPALGHALEATQGYRTTKDGGIAFRYEGLDRALKAAGFRPIEETIANDLRSINYTNDTIYRTDRKRLVNELALKLLRGEQLTADDKARAKELNLKMTDINKAKKKLTQTTQERLKESLSKRQKESLKGTPFDNY